MKRLLVFLCAVLCLSGMGGITHAELIDNRDGTVSQIKDDGSAFMWLKDAGMEGRRGWYDALDWADNLVFADFDNWRLPLSDISGDCGDPLTNTYDCTGSEMGHMYYTELGNVAAYGGPNEPLNVGPFTNLIPYGYWSGTGTQAGSSREKP